MQRDEVGASLQAGNRSAICRRRRPIPVKRLRAGSAGAGDVPGGRVCNSYVRMSVVTPLTTVGWGGGVMMSGEIVAIDVGTRIIGILA